MGRSLYSSRGREWGGLYTHLEEREWGGLYTHLEEGEWRGLYTYLEEGSGEVFILI